MEKIIFNHLSQLQREKSHLESQLKVKINIEGKIVSIEGNPVDEYEANIILEAIDLGFSIKKALSLKDEELVFKRINIKNYTKRKKLHEVRARVIGTEGKTKKTIEEIASCSMVINENDVGIIGPADKIEEAVTALKNLIRGSKQANVYRYLEKINSLRKKKDFVGNKNRNL